MSLLGKNEVIETPRLKIKMARASDLEHSSWLEKALEPEWERANLERQLAAGNCLAFEDAAGELIGAAVVVSDEPARGWASIPFIAVIPLRRFSGLGGEAAIAIERRLR